MWESDRLVFDWEIRVKSFKSETYDPGDILKILKKSVYIKNKFKHFPVIIIIILYTTEMKKNIQS